MDYSKIGGLIYSLRREMKLTQKQLAEKLNISDKAVSKWERGLGCPDISIFPSLSEIFKIDIEKLLAGELSVEKFVGGNMKKSKFFVCPDCGNITICTGNSTIICCGRKLDNIIPEKADESAKLLVERIDDEWYISSDHPMQKENYISFIAFVTGGRIEIVKQYPEWTMQARFSIREHGTLLWYENNNGLFYQTI